MPRKARIKSTTGIYHVMLRGLNGQDLFHKDEDYLFFQKRLLQLSHPKDVRGEPMTPFCHIYAYCLMTNHVHLLLRTTGKDLSEVVKSLAVSYARYYNQVFSRRGYLFQDRFRSEPVEDFNYLITLFRYIHQNPLKAGLVRDVDLYRWSSWQEYSSASGCTSSICEKSFILDQVDLNQILALVKQPLEDKDCFKLEENDPPSDDDVRQMLSERLKGGLKPECMNDLPKNERNEILLSVLQKGAGIRQLRRITGIGFKVIQKLAAKKESKSPSP